jgi:hypothetical protein
MIKASTLVQETQMGFYVNPQKETKEAFLARCGRGIDAHFKWQNLPAGSLPVTLVDNGPFTAAAICYSKEEFEEFTDPNDRRLRMYYLVKIEDLLPVGGSDFAGYMSSQAA